MRTFNLIMPKKGNEITVKFVNAPYRVGDNVYVDVKVFGDQARNTYRMKIGKSLWASLHSTLVFRYFWMDKPGESLDKNLDCTVGKMFTISGVSDPLVTFTDKEGKQVSGKGFDVKLREDLEKAELEGDEVYNQALQKEVVQNFSCHDCYRANMALADEEEQKAKDREEKKKLKAEKSEKLKKLDQFKPAKPKQTQGQIYPDPAQLWS